MKLHYYVPFWITYISSKIIDRLKGPVKLDSKWHKYFSTGYNKENFSLYLDDMKKEDFQAFLIMVVAPHGLFVCVLILFLW